MLGDIGTFSLLSRLPSVRGRYVEQAPLAGITWFRVGGPAEVLFTPEDADDLATFLAAKPKDVPVTMLGLGSNLLVRDQGVRGVVIRLGRAFAKVSVEGLTVSAGAAAACRTVALAARDHAITGFEFLNSVPGAIGGSLRMNAGAYGSEMKDVVVGADALDEAGTPHALELADFGFAYRASTVPEGWIFTAARLAGKPGKSEDVTKRMQEINTARKDSQPIPARTGGSTFKNPPGHKAWELIDAAGCRGLRRGAAMVSEQHCNFLINTGGASATDLELLGEDVRRRVFDTSGISLTWEIRRIGELPPDGLMGHAP